jgi:hypothetical protein
VKRPPDKKWMLATTILLVAASMLLSQQVIGLTPGSHGGSPSVVVAKVFGRS